MFIAYIHSKKKKINQFLHRNNILSLVPSRLEFGEKYKITIQIKKKLNKIKKE